MRRRKSITCYPELFIAIIASDEIDAECYQSANNRSAIPPFVRPFHGNDDEKINCVPA